MPAFVAPQKPRYPLESEFVKRSALVFLVAIFLPSLVLGWLALRTAGEQRILIERQAADLHQAETDVIAATIRTLIEEKQTSFAEVIRSLVATQGVAALAENYGPALATVWQEGGTPFAINPQGRIAYPSPALARTSAPTESFLQENAAFLGNRASAEIYQPQQQAAPAKAESKAKPRQPSLSKSVPSRNVLPQKDADTAASPQASQLAVEVSDFQTAVSGSAQGILSRFAQDELQVIFWTRPDPASEWLFGVLLSPRDIDAFIHGALPSPPASETQLAILNEKTRPVARSPLDFSATWSRPFVASEIGEILPHWEVALYLTNPGALTNTARLVSITLSLLIALALAAILAGGYFVAAATRRQLALAQKKTDFVSNVSHELKTPLTSIRMFAELLEEGRVDDPEKRSRYLRIISAESERLTRLVNNVLDFARLEKKRQNYAIHRLDAHAVIARVWETESLRLRAAGFQVAWQADAGPYALLSNDDAIAQILVNLISNAEKYHGSIQEILLTSQRRDGRLLIQVSDRGPGIPPGLEQKIFEPFFRADDSLASEVQGSGLGLTLARRIAREIRGDLTYAPRDGGGSTFTLTLPLTR